MKIYNWYDLKNFHGGNFEFFYPENCFFSKNFITLDSLGQERLSRMFSSLKLSYIYTLITVLLKKSGQNILCQYFLE